MSTNTFNSRFIFGAVLIFFLVVLAVFPFLGVLAQSVAQLNIVKTVRNISSGSGFAAQVNANPNDIVEFKIVVTNTGNENLTDLLLTDSLPSRLTYVSGSLNANPPAYSGHLFSGNGILALTDLKPGSSNTVIFRARVASLEQFSIGETILTNTATAREVGATPASPVSDTARVRVVRQQAVLPPTADIKANGSDGPITIPQNTSATITWTSTNADSCSVSPTGWTGISGSQSTGSLSFSQIYNLFCSGPGGTATDFVTVNVQQNLPTVSISANPSTITRGNSSILSWTSSNADNCRASGGWSGTKTLSGSQSVSPEFATTYTITCSNQFGTATDSATVNVQQNLPTVSISANPSTINKNDSSILSWTSSNADNCQASNGWSGSRSLFGSLVVWPQSNTTYTITCSNQFGTATDSATVNVVGQETSSDFTVRKTVRNLSKNTVFVDSVAAEPGNQLVFGIGIRAVNISASNVIVQDILPSGIIFMGDLRVDNVLVAGNILTGLNIGSLSAGQEVRITFRGDVAAAENFAFGQTQLVNTASVSSGSVSRSDTATVTVTRAAVAGVTTITTGLTNNLLLDTLLIPLVFALVAVWLFKSRILKLEEWLDIRKREYQIYKSKKLLQIKIAKTKAKELLQKLT